MSFEAMTFAEVLDDLQSRFIINVPDEELSSVERVCFQIEQAHWFYEDFIREQNPRLPSLSLKRFSATFFNHCEFLSTSFSALDHEEAFENFMSYKVRVPVCGAIILNEGLKKILLVRGWKSNAGWGFPKGKINKDEPEITCAIREVYEEIGFDIGDRVKADQYVERTLKDQKIRLYIITDVPETTKFKPQTRKEIGGIEWISLEFLPGWTDHTPVQRGKYYMVVPFVQGIKSWVKRLKRHQTRESRKQKKKPASSALAPESSLGYRSATDAEGKSATDVDSETEHILSRSSHEREGINLHQQILHLQKQQMQHEKQLRQLQQMQNQQTVRDAGNLDAMQTSLDNSSQTLLSVQSYNQLSQAPQQNYKQIDPAASLKAMLNIGTSAETKHLPSPQSSNLTAYANNQAMVGIMPQFVPVPQFPLHNSYGPRPVPMVPHAINIPGSQSLLQQNSQIQPTDILLSGPMYPSASSPAVSLGTNPQRVSPAVPASLLFAAEHAPVMNSAGIEPEIVTRTEKQKAKGVGRAKKDKASLLAIITNGGTLAPSLPPPPDLKATWGPTPLPGFSQAINRIPATVISPIHQFSLNASPLSHQINPASTNPSLVDRSADSSDGFSVHKHGMIQRRTSSSIVMQTRSSTSPVSSADDELSVDVRPNRSFTRMVGVDRRLSLENGFGRLNLNRDIGNVRNVKEDSVDGGTERDRTDDAPSRPTFVDLSSMQSTTSPFPSAQEGQPQFGLMGSGKKSSAGTLAALVMSPNDDADFRMRVLQLGTGAGKGLGLFSNPASQGGSTTALPLPTVPSLPSTGNEADDVLRRVLSLGEYNQTSPGTTRLPVETRPVQPLQPESQNQSLLSIFFPNKP